MRWPSKRHRLVVECKSSTDITTSYEQLMPPRGWCRMPLATRKKWLEARHRWELSIYIEIESGAEERVVVVYTPTQLREVNHVISKIIEDAVGSSTQALYAKVIALTV